VARRAPTASGPVVEAEVVYLAAQRIAVDAEGVSGLGTVAIALFEDSADEFLFKFSDRILVADAVFDKLVDELFQLLSHGATPIYKILSFGID
jgi:hypothetical protein